MTKTLTPIETVISDLKEVFEINNNSFGSKENQGAFYIHKSHFERFLVIEKLSNYFSDKVIEKGYCLVGSITFIFTHFHICEGEPPKN
jgi:hypothetical protein